MRSRRSLLGGCGVFGGKPKSPDEFAVARNAPLVIPPDYHADPAGRRHRRLTAGRTPSSRRSTPCSAAPPRAARPRLSMLEQAGRDRAAARRPLDRRRSRHARRRQGPGDASHPGRAGRPTARSRRPRCRSSKTARGERGRPWLRRHCPPAWSRSKSMLDRSRRRFEEGIAAGRGSAQVAGRDPAGADRHARSACRPKTARKPPRGCSPVLKASGGEMPETLCGGRLAVDQVQRLIRIDGHPIGITEMEYRVLELLAFARNNVVTRADAAEASLSPRRRPAAAEDHRRVHLQAAQEAAHRRRAGRSSSRRSRSAAGSCATSTRPRALKPLGDSPTFVDHPRAMLRGMFQILSDRSRWPTRPIAGGELASRIAGLQRALRLRRAERRRARRATRKSSTRSSSPATARARCFDSRSERIDRRAAAGLEARGRRPQRRAASPIRRRSTWSPKRSARGLAEPVRR